MVDGAVCLCRKEDLAEGIDRSRKVAATDVDTLCLEKSLKLLVQLLSKYAPWYNEDEAGLHNQLDGINCVALRAEAVESLGTALQAFMALSLDGTTLDELLKFEAELVKATHKLDDPAHALSEMKPKMEEAANRVQQQSATTLHTRQTATRGPRLSRVGARWKARCRQRVWCLLGRPTCTFLRLCAW